MSILGLIHRSISENRLLGTVYRRQIISIKRAVGAADAFGDMIDVIRSRKIGCLIDVGAHVGDYSERICRMLGSDVLQVVAVEPQPEACATLRHKLGARAGTTIVEAALSSTGKELKLFRPKWDQMSSLLEPVNVDFETITVATKTLDDIAPKNLTCAVKLDVQGAELDVLRSGSKTLSDNCEAVYAEVLVEKVYEGQGSFDEINSLLEKCGFRLSQVYPVMKNSQGYAIQFDALWTKFQ
jgi:FkbM family methyltransferase